MFKQKLVDRYLDPHTLPRYKKSLVKIRSPIKPFRSRQIGYKNTPNHIVVIAKIAKGGLDPRITKKGRCPSNIYKKYSWNISHYEILKNKCLKIYRNMVCLGGYLINETGSHKWYEFILRSKI